MENDAADAFLYAFRGAHHRFGKKPAAPAPEYLSPEWVKNLEREELRKARAAARQEDSILRSPFAMAPTPVRRALNRTPLMQQGLDRTQWIKTAASKL